MKLSAWLKEATPLLPRLEGVTTFKFAEAHDDDIEHWAEQLEDGQWEFPDDGTPSEAWHIFSALALLGEFSEEDEWKRHHAWVREYDHKDSDEWHLLPELVGVKFDEVLKRFPQPWDDTSLPALLSACNQLAEERGLAERFVNFATDGDSYVLAVVPAASVQPLGALVSLSSLPAPPRKKRDASQPSPSIDFTSGAVSPLGQTTIPPRVMLMVVGGVLLFVLFACWRVVSTH